MSSPPAAGADRAYCAEALDALARLEKVSRRRNEARRDLERAVAHRRTRWAGLIALVLPVLVGVYFLLTQLGIFHADGAFVGAGRLMTRAFGLVTILVLLYLVGFFLVGALWPTRVMRPLREADERRLRSRYLAERAQIDGDAERILAEPVLAEGRIPEKYLAPNLLTVLLRLFDSGQATFLDAAVYMLDMEIATSAYYAHVVPAETLVARERAQIAQDRAEEVSARG